MEDAKTADSGALEPVSGESETRLPRRFAGYLLTSSLESDAIGRVYRALPLGDGDGSREFVRLRMFDSPELPPGPVARAFMNAAERARRPAGSAIAARSRIGFQDGTPFLAWDESHGTSLARLLTILRQRHEALPPEHALLIADRLALALEQAAGRAGGDGGERHGLLWPGFVVIGRDGDVRLGGFGIAAAVLPFLGAPRLSSEVAPYLAPETRGSAPGNAAADVYSVGAILAELLTGHPPAASSAADVAAAPGLPRGVDLALKSALAAPHVRTMTAGALRRAVGQAIVVNHCSPSSRDLAEFVSDRVGGAPGRESVRIHPAEPEEDDWDRVLQRLEPTPEPAAPRPRSGARARVPLPPPFSSRPGSSPEDHRRSG